MGRNAWIARAGAIVVALLLGVGGWALAGTSRAPGAERALAQVDAEISELLEQGLTEADGKIRLLEAERERILAASQNPGPDPDPLLARRSLHIPTGPMTVEVGEVECEPMRPFTDGVDLRGDRCVSVARADGGALFVYLTPREEALVVRLSGQATSSREPIPALPDLAAATLSVDDRGVIHVASPGGTTKEIQTDLW